MVGAAGVTSVEVNAGGAGSVWPGRTEAGTVVAGAGTGVVGRKEEPASRRLMVSAAAPCSLRWSATARRLRNTRMSGLEGGG